MMPLRWLRAGGISDFVLPPVIEYADSARDNAARWCVGFRFVAAARFTTAGHVQFRQRTV